MKKYSTKKHLSLQICEKEDWVKHNHKQHRTYRNVDDQWKQKLQNLSADKKQEMFFKYAYEGNKKMLKYICQADGEQFDINLLDKDGNNALMFAVKSGSKETVAYLLQIGVNPNYINNLGISPFHLAVRKNTLNLVATLYDHKANIHIKDKNGAEAIFDAVCEDNPKMIQTLILNGIDVNTTNNQGQTPIMVAAQNEKRQEAMLTLLAYGADVNLSDCQGKNALMHAIAYENNPLMDILLKHGTDLNAKDARGKTALMHLSQKGNREALRVLISRGANIFEKDIFGKTALDYAIKNNHKTCAEILTKAQKIYNSDLTFEQKMTKLKEFAKHNKVQNSCAR